MHEALVRGGIFVFDVVTRDADDRGWRMGDDWVTLYEAEEKDGTITRHITTFRAVDGSYRRSDEVHRLRLYPVSAIADSLREAGFRVRLRRGYGTVALSPNVRAFVATKPR